MATIPKKNSRGMKHIVVIGAGPAGLTAATELLKHGNCLVTVLEATDMIGGIAQTVCHNGNRMDIGGHRFFSKSDTVMAWWLKRMPHQGSPACDDLLLNRKTPLSPNGPDPQKTDRVMLVRNRLSRIYFLRKFFDYPISIRPQTFFNLGWWRTLQAGIGYLEACIFKQSENNLEDFLINRFGRPLYRMFFEDYTQKVWGKHPTELAADWGAQRIKGLSLGHALKVALLKPFSKNRGEDIRQKKKETSLIEEFFYPKYGPGQLWEIVANEIREAGGTILLQTRATHLQIESNRVVHVEAEGPNGSISIKCDHILSSMPICDLVKACHGKKKSSEISQIASELPYRDFLTVGIEVKRLAINNHTGLKTLNNLIPDCWIYIQERDVKIGRLQIFNNWSPYLVKNWKNNVWLGLEYFCSEQDEIYRMPSQQFINFAINELVQIGMIQTHEDVLDAVRVFIPKAYPAYYGSYKQFPVIRRWLDQIQNLWCIGRNGQHRYNNQDHSMLCAMEAVQQIVSESREIDRVWAVNTEEEYHEAKAPYDNNSHPS